LLQADAVAEACAGCCAAAEDEAGSSEEEPSEEGDGEEAAGEQRKDAVVVDDAVSDMDYLRARMSARAFAEEEREEGAEAEPVDEADDDDEVEEDAEAAAQHGDSLPLPHPLHGCLHAALMHIRIHKSCFGAFCKEACRFAAASPALGGCHVQLIIALCAGEGGSEEGEEEDADAERRLSHGRAAPSSPPAGAGA
jgi:hypothetical protein